MRKVEEGLGASELSAKAFRLDKEGRWTLPRQATSDAGHRSSVASGAPASELQLQTLIEKRAHGASCESSSCCC